MRYRDLKFEDVEINVDSVDLQIKATDELIDLTNKIRKNKGNDDLVELDCCNDVYYDFYLICYPNKKEVEIMAICNHGELDDYVGYGLSITNEEKEDIMFQLIKELINLKA